jgi:Ni/Fe-hydrogenase subunit HybB-like protein
MLGMPVSRYIRSLCTPFNFVALLILAIGIPVAWIRFTRGLDSTTNLTNDYPWGLWIGFDVLCGVALAAGGFCIASAVHVFGLRDYQAIVRPAILTGFLGYFFVVIGLLFDLGRPWRLPYPLFISQGHTSIMFEVACCVALYLNVLFLEFSPALLEWLGWKVLRKWILRLTLAASILGVVLSTLHQSSLGALFLVAPGKVHPLWYSSYIPVFFFVSCIAAGLSMVIVESMLSHRIFAHQVTKKNHQHLDELTVRLAKGAAIVLATYFVLKWIGVAHDHRWAYLGTGFGLWYLVEILGFVLLPCLLFALAVKKSSASIARAAAVWTILGIILNRLNIALFTFNWQLPDRYIPHWMEFAVTITIVTVGLLTFRFVVNRMPILYVHPEFPEEH